MILLAENTLFIHCVKSKTNQELVSYESHTQKNHGNGKSWMRYSQNRNKTYPLEQQPHEKLAKLKNHENK